MSLQAVIKDIGIHITAQKEVHGGDINQAYHLATDTAAYFLKVNSAKLYPDMFKLEAAGLGALRKGSKLVIPATIKYGQADDEQYLLLEWLEKGTAAESTMHNFGAALAMMHKEPQPFFGWQLDNYVGSILQSNKNHDNWFSFYAGCRILPLVKQLADDGQFSKSVTTEADSLCNKLNNYFPKEPPALLHGDLWGGNYMITGNGDVAIFDPAVYYGHREMDMGMTKLFGGFDGSFYDGYNEVYPLEKGWQQRLELTQLFPILVHAVLFGGHYISSAKSIIQKFA